MDKLFGFFQISDRILQKMLKPNSKQIFEISYGKNLGMDKFGGSVYLKYLWIH